MRRQALLAKFRRSGGETSPFKGRAQSAPGLERCAFRASFSLAGAGRSEAEGGGLLPFFFYFYFYFTPSKNVEFAQFLISYCE